MNCARLSKDQSVYMCYINCYRHSITLPCGTHLSFRQVRGMATSEKIVIVRSSLFHSLEFSSGAKNSCK
jgi:hypothetical protein